MGMSNAHPAKVPADTLASRPLYRLKDTHGVKIRLALVAFMLPLSGCAFMVHDVRVDYVFRGSVASDLNASREKLRLGSFDDSRDNPNVRMIIHETNGYGQPTSGGWQAEKPISEIVRDAVAQGLVAAHAPVVESDETVVLTGEVLDYRYRFEEQFWSGDVFPMLTVKFRLKDAVSHDTIWSKEITGSGKYHGSFMPATELLFRGALDDLALRVASDGSLAQALSHPEHRR